MWNYVILFYAWLLKNLWYNRLITRKGRKKGSFEKLIYSKNRFTRLLKGLKTKEDIKKSIKWKGLQAMKTYKEYGISIYEDYNDLYNRIREDLKDMNNNDIANIIQELIYTINEGVKEEETINQINDILFNEEEEREGL